MYLLTTIAGIKFQKHYIEKGHEAIAEMSLVRFYYDGKLYDYSDIVEIKDMTGQVFYRDLKTILYLFSNKDTFSLSLFMKNKRHSLATSDYLLKNKELFTQVLLYDRLDLTKTVEFEKSRRATIEKEQQQAKETVDEIIDIRRKVRESNEETRLLQEDWKFMVNWL